MSDKKIDTIYVELDVLLDTRLGTVARLDEEAAKSLLEKDYHTRESDIFKGVNNEEYISLYSKRDTVTLAHSAITESIILIRHLLGVYGRQLINHPLRGELKLTVNTYPYVLTEEELSEIGLAVKEWIQDLARVEIVTIPTKDLTPAHCKRAYNVMMIYDHPGWMNTHTEAFNTTLLPEVTLFAPAIYFKPPPTKEEVMKHIQELMHPMEALEKLASPIINLTLIDVKYFSVIQNR